MAENHAKSRNSEKEMMIKKVKIPYSASRTGETLKKFKHIKLINPIDNKWASTLRVKDKKNDSHCLPEHKYMNFIQLADDQKCQIQNCGK